MEHEAAAPRISVIIPTWHDDEYIAALLPNLRALDEVHEIIVVDAANSSSIDRLVLDHGARIITSSEPSRGEQMNAGAAAASGDVLVFLHADTDFVAAHFAALREALRDPGVIGGAFYRKFDERHPHLLWLEGVARYMTRRGGTLFGDQTVFVRRSIFEQLGGFAKVPLMEDVEFTPRLRASGRIVILDPPIRTSARHHDGKGAWRRSIQNGLFLLLYKVGVSPARLHRWYYS